MLQANYRPKQQAFDWGHEFMGAILNHRWVVTGGVNIVHKCVKYSRCRIIAGTTNVSVNTRHGTVINVEKVYPHYTSRPNSTGVGFHVYFYICIHTCIYERVCMR